ncbi:MAG: hypothetical protein RLZZ383_3032 [Pseudomonadota bacterium]
MDRVARRYGVRAETVEAWRAEALAGIGDALRRGADGHAAGEDRRVRRSPGARRRRGRLPPARRRRRQRALRRRRPALPQASPHSVHAAALRVRTWPTQDTRTCIDQTPGSVSAVKPDAPSFARPPQRPWGTGLTPAGRSPGPHPKPRRPWSRTCLADRPLPERTHPKRSPATDANAATSCRATAPTPHVSPGVTGPLRPMPRPHAATTRIGTAPRDRSAGARWNSQPRHPP